MRRPVALAFSLLAVVASLPAPALAQEPAATLTLLAQTPWNDPDTATTELRLRAENVGETDVGDLFLWVTLWSPVTSRSQYEASLIADPVGGVPLQSKPFPRRGALAPGDAREFVVPFDLPVDRIDATSSRVYPLTIELRSGFTPLAAVRSSVIFLVRQPETPLDVSWTFVVSAPLMTGPDGVFSSTALEDSISGGGRLAGMLTALRAMADAGVRLDLVVSPVLLMQLDAMRDGYTVSEFGQVRTVAEGDGASDEAVDALATLRSVASAESVELSALPFSAARLPALAAGGLSADVAVQLERGGDVVATMLHRTPDAAVLRPPGSALDEESLEALASQGVDLLILDDATVPAPEQDLGFAAPPTTIVSGREAELPAVVGDRSIRSLLSNGSTAVFDDPVRAAHAVLAELATIWLEQPSVERGVAVVFDESAPLLPGAFFPPLGRALAQLPPWLGARTATDLVAAFPPSAPAPTFEESADAFSQPYAESIKTARRRINTLRTMLVEPSEQPARLETLLLLAESGQFVGREDDGRVFVDRVHNTVAGIFEAVHALPNQIFTLTADSADIPVRVTNDSNVALKVVVELRSSSIGATQGQTVTLAPGTSPTLTFNIELRQTGRRDVDVNILSPSQRRVGPVVKVYVQSTAYNRVALWITLGAAALAFAVWARRFVPRRTA